MGDLPHFFDIILFAMVAAFLVLRLRSVLGRRTGNERRRDLFVRGSTPAADNKIVKHVLDDFVFSGIEIASAGQPIFVGMSGTVYSGATSASSYADEGNIYGGAISSSSGFATTGRAPQVGRNSIIGPGYNDFDLRVARDVPIHESLKLQFAADAFNLLNHTIITGVNGTYSQYTSAAATGACSTATQTPGPATAPLQGCIAPFSGTALSAFGATSSTSSSSLYGARQLQVSTKLVF